MISIINYISAKNRLKESNKTVIMMGDDCSDMIKAQNEMIKMERDYYRDEMYIFLIGLCAVFVFSMIIFGILNFYDII
jgi:hypothetical protein